MAKIVLDAGHGGHDGGASAYGLLEKTLTLQIVLKIRDYLNKHYTGHTIKLTRSTDKYLTLTQRTNIANNWGADYFMSIHINAGGGTGYEDYIYNGNVSAATRTNQDIINREVIKATGWTNRGKKRANFAVVRQTNMPAILTESGFIDRKSDADKLKSDSFLNK